MGRVTTSGSLPGLSSRTAASLRIRCRTATVASGSSGPGPPSTAVAEVSTTSWPSTSASVGASIPTAALVASTVVPGSASRIAWGLMNPLGEPIAGLPVSPSSAIAIRDVVCAPVSSSGARWLAADASTSPYGNVSSCLPASAVGSRFSHSCPWTAAAATAAGSVGSVGSVRASPVPVVADGDSVGAGSSPSSTGSAAGGIRDGLPATREFTAAITAGSISQVIGREPASTPISSRVLNRPPGARSTAQRAGWSTRPSAAYTMRLRSWRTSAVGSAGRPSSTSGMNVRARPSARSSRPSTFSPSACTPSQCTPSVRPRKRRGTRSV